MNSSVQIIRQSLFLAHPDPNWSIILELRDILSNMTATSSSEDDMTHGTHNNLTVPDSITDAAF